LLHREIQVNRLKGRLTEIEKEFNKIYILWNMPLGETTKIALKTDPYGGVKRGMIYVSFKYHRLKQYQV